MGGRFVEVRYLRTSKVKTCRRNLGVGKHTLASQRPNMIGGNTRSLAGLVNLR